LLVQETEEQMLKKSPEKSKRKKIFKKKSPENLQQVPKIETQSLLPLPFIHRQKQSKPTVP